MKQQPRKSVEPGGKVHRRFPGLTAEDVAALNALDPAAARELERELRAQARRDKRHQANETPEAELAPGALEQLHAARAARWSHGAGGGRRRPRAEPRP